jgi:hypothetical protein
MIHHVLIDYGNDYYMTAVDASSSKESVLDYFEQYSPDVRYHRATHERSKHDTGTHKCPLGTIIKCSYFENKTRAYKSKDGRGKYKLDILNNAEIDRRHKC